MRNRALHDALRDFALEAAARLVRATDGGAEIEFALDESSDGGATLYRYRPLTAEFIAARWTELRLLPSFDPAARALGTGARAYLRRRGEPGADAEPALRMMLERLYEDSTSFAFPEDRFERVYGGVERALYAGTVRASVVAPVLGLRLEGARVELGGELALVDVALLAPAPSTDWLEGEEGPGAGSPATAYLVLERDLPSDAPLPVGEARTRFGSALMALRLLDRGGLALGPLGFSRVGEGRWQPLRLDPSGQAHGPERTLAADDAEELRDLVDALESGPCHGPVAWALDRFGMGLERESEVESLSDYLLALRALLDRGRGAEPATVALRLAALCAEEDDRRAVQRRVESAFALEPFVIEGGLGAARGERYVEAVGRHGPQVLVREVEDALRHLLSGVLREELEPDLAGLADETLLRTAEPVEIRAMRIEESDDDASPSVRFPGRTGLAVVERPATVGERDTIHEAGASEMEADEGPAVPLASKRGEDFGWNPDDEGESYSAPV